VRGFKVLNEIWGFLTAQSVLKIYTLTDLEQRVLNHAAICETDLSTAVNALKRN
jgi:hypothetical protein